MSIAVASRYTLIAVSPKFPMRVELVIHNSLSCTRNLSGTLSMFAVAALLTGGFSFSQDAKWQYESGEILIPAATSTEPRVTSFGKASVLAAAKYLDDGAAAWAESHSCVACHTTGSYMAERPALSPWLGIVIKYKCLVFHHALLSHGKKSLGDHRLGLRADCTFSSRYGQSKRFVLFLSLLLQCLCC